MKSELKKGIHEVLNLLAQRDPDWKRVKMLPKFKVLYQGWRAKELRQHVHSHIFYTNSWKRGWLPWDDWKRFKDYALQ